MSFLFGRQCKSHAQVSLLNLRSKVNTLRWDTPNKPRTLKRNFLARHLCACARLLRRVGPGGRGRLLTPGSHRPVRARIRAYGSSNHGFAALGRSLDRTARAGASGYRARMTRNFSHVIDRMLLRRLSHRRQRGATSWSNRFNDAEFPVTP